MTIFTEHWKKHAVSFNIELILVPKVDSRAKVDGRFWVDVDLMLNLSLYGEVLSGVTLCGLIEFVSLIFGLITSLRSNIWRHSGSLTDTNIFFFENLKSSLECFLQKLFHSSPDYHEQNMTQFEGPSTSISGTILRCWFNQLVVLQPLQFRSFCHQYRTLMTLLFRWYIRVCDNFPTLNLSPTEFISDICQIHQSVLISVK